MFSVKFGLLYRDFLVRFEVFVNPAPKENRKIIKIDETCYKEFKSCKKEVEFILLAGLEILTKACE